ncbi:circadian clock protein KaiC [Candidatus Magnetominusculus xianensis]|uniref:non-specific serine/threonine protein kinase n=1 Tax=Candidatus Magnetominusculus xianensis TaxID=1748249 RepID=A0ABR5SBZ9_9BACT|nr:circadian clock protein KaiC [Candidatus Magnetominusculus xianensis]KWT78287.1 circadian clock protein KaiC [Candidatus Magnetominusculus xianensis]MBF0404024.1 circadian clock protein KaiC [Nitrospirota bacterium]
MSKKIHTTDVQKYNLKKSLTGIHGLDEITGGLPKGRPTLVCGNVGCGKTLLAMEFLVHGAKEYDEPGIFMSFDETAEDIVVNVESLAFNINDLMKSKKIILDHVYIDRKDFEVTGEYDLEGLFIRLEYAINTIGAKRVVLDTIESLFAGLQSHNILRAELRRLFRWLKEKGLTAIITAERGDGVLTRHGIEEYVADCVILLDHRVEGQRSTRRLRVVKYRGSTHGANEYPFLIDTAGISVFPITSLGLEHKASTEHISTGIPRLDTMLDGRGYFCGSSILVSGTAGTGKTSLAIHLVKSTCQRGERCLYIASEESMYQIIRNSRSIGIDLEPFIESGILRFNASRPTSFGMENHLVTIHKLIDEFNPSVCVMDPISNYSDIGSNDEVKILMMRLVDLMKSRNITSIYTTLTAQGEFIDNTDIGISSLMDTWIVLKTLEYNGERTRGLYVIKSRGMSHSNQIREFIITDKGIELLDAYTGSGMVLTGTARIVQEAKDRADDFIIKQKMERRLRELESKRKEAEARVEALMSAIANDQAEIDMILSQESARIDIREKVTAEILKKRQPE